MARKTRIMTIFATGKKESTKSTLNLIIPFCNQVSLKTLNETISMKVGLKDLTITNRFLTKRKQTKSKV